MTILRFLLGLFLIFSSFSRLGDKTQTPSIISQEDTTQISKKNTSVTTPSSNQKKTAKTKENKTLISQKNTSVTTSSSNQKKTAKLKIVILPENITSEQFFSKNASNKNKLRDLVYSWIKIKKQQPKEDPCIDLLQSPFFNEVKINTDQSYSILSLGNFIQGKSLYSQSLAQLPIPPSYRFPIRILSNQDIEPFWTKSSSAADVNQGIKNALKNYRGYIVPQTYVKIQRYQESDNSNFNVNNVKIFNRNMNIIPKNKKVKKVELIIVQKTIEFSVDKIVSDQDDINDPIGVFFRQNFDIQTAKRLKKFKYWGNDNIPCYIDSITYGKLLVAKVDENSKTLKIYNRFQQQSEISEDLVTEFLNQDNIQVQSLGSNDKDKGQVQLGKWTNLFRGDFFTQSGFQTLKPIAYKIKDFRGQIAKQFCFIESAY